MTKATEAYTEKRAQLKKRNMTLNMHVNNGLYLSEYLHYEINLTITEFVDLTGVSRFTLDSWYKSPTKYKTLALLVEGYSKIKGRWLMFGFRMRVRDYYYNKRKLKDLIKEYSGLSVNEFSNLSGVSRFTLNNWYNSSTKSKTLAMLLLAFKK